ncbi:MAG: hypothetical protein K0B87_04990 [Candidatus Syntrophosphaera sp.]|nr:hypothetical protein [Candidatus Syntrophosphaera sp.]
MKRFLLLIVLAALMASLSANVLIPRYIARVWFDDTDDFHVMFGDEAFWEDFDVTDLSFTTSAGTYYLPATYVQPGEPTFIINLSQEIPGFTIQRNEDFLSMAIPYQYFPEELRWGPQNDLSVHIRPLGQGQAAVQVRIDVYTGYGEYDSALTWAKDSQTLCPNSYEVFSNSTLGIHLEDANGAPAAGIPIYSSHLNYAAASDLYYWGSTNTYGNWERTGDAIRRSILVIDPQTADPVIQELIFPEPGETIQLSGVLSSSAGNDPHLIPSAGVLSLHPSLLNRSSGSAVNLKYESPESLDPTAELRLYDLRGRFLAGKAMPASGIAVWDLPFLGSGIYYIALSEGDRILGRARITVIK